MANVENYANSGDRRNLGNSHAEEIKECAVHVKEELGKAGKIVKDATQEKLTDLQKVGSDQLHRLTDYAKERPLTSILIAGAVGFIGARLLRRS